MAGISGATCERRIEVTPSALSQLAFTKGKADISVPVSLCASSRAAISMPPPGGYGTMSRTGLTGYVYASAALPAQFEMNERPIARTTIAARML